jgi:hypothetical protein
MQTPSPMTLGNMRENGVGSLLVTCSNVTCRHEKIVNVDAYGARQHCRAMVVSKLGSILNFQLDVSSHSQASMS